MALIMQLEEFLKQNNIEYEIVTKEESFIGVAQCGENPPFEKDSVKAVIVKTVERLTMTVHPAPDRIDPDYFNEVLEGEGTVFATQDEFDKLLMSCETGTEPPIGSHYDLEGFVEDTLHRGQAHMIQWWKPL